MLYTSDRVRVQGLQGQCVRQKNKNYWQVKNTNETLFESRPSTSTCTVWKPIVAGVKFPDSLNAPTESVRPHSGTTHDSPLDVPESRTDTSAGAWVILRVHGVLLQYPLE